MLYFVLPGLHFYVREPLSRILSLANVVDRTPTNPVLEPTPVLALSTRTLTWLRACCVQDSCVPRTFFFSQLFLYAGSRSNTRTRATARRDSRDATKERRRMTNGVRPRIVSRSPWLVTADGHGSDYETGSNRDTQDFILYTSKRWENNPDERQIPPCPLSTSVITCLQCANNPRTPTPCVCLEPIRAIYPPKLLSRYRRSNEINKKERKSRKKNRKKNRRNPLFEMIDSVPIGHALAHTLLTSAVRKRNAPRRAAFPRALRDRERSATGHCDRRAKETRNWEQEERVSDTNWKRANKKARETLVPRRTREEIRENRETEIGILLASSECRAISLYLTETPFYSFLF